MKYLGLMHYFLGLEIWHINDEIFLSQGKYIMDVILCAFGMVDFKSIGISMLSNLRKLHEFDTRSDLVDPTLYKQLIISLMYLIHSRLDIFYCNAPIFGISMVHHYVHSIPMVKRKLIMNKELMLACGTLDN